MANKTTEERLGVNEEAIITLKKSDKEQWDAINELRRFMHKFVPIWTTVILMAMSAVTASALTFAGMILKFVNSK